MFHKSKAKIAKLLQSYRYRRGLHTLSGTYGLQYLPVPSGSTHPFRHLRSAVLTGTVGVYPPFQASPVCGTYRYRRGLHTLSGISGLRYIPSRSGSTHPFRHIRSAVLTGTVGVYTPFQAPPVCSTYRYRRSLHTLSCISGLQYLPSRSGSTHPFRHLRSAVHTVTVRVYIPFQASPVCGTYRYRRGLHTLSGISGLRYLPVP